MRGLCALRRHEFESVLAHSLNPRNSSRYPSSKNTMSGKEGDRVSAQEMQKNEYQVSLIRKASAVARSRGRVTHITIQTKPRGRRRHRGDKGEGEGSRIIADGVQ